MRVCFIVVLCWIRVQKKLHLPLANFAIVVTPHSQQMCAWSHNMFVLRQIVVFSFSARSDEEGRTMVFFTGEQVQEHVPEKQEEPRHDDTSSVQSGSL